MEKIVDGIRFRLSEDGQSYQVIGFTPENRDTKEAIIPSMVDNIPVTEIGCYAFRNSICLREITIPDGVKYIGRNAFDGCRSLEKLTIPSHIKLEDRVCANCKGLADKNGFIIVNGTLFGYCGPGGDIEIPNNVKRIDNLAFLNCDRLTSIKIPNSVTNIAEQAFWGCYHLTNIVIPDSVNSIGCGAFHGCDNLKNVRFPENIDLGKNVLQYCESLESVTFGSITFTPETFREKLEQHTRQSQSDRDDCR